MTGTRPAVVACSLAALVVVGLGVPSVGSPASTHPHATAVARTRSAGSEPAGRVRRVRMLRCGTIRVDEATGTASCRRIREVRVLATKESGRWYVVTPSGRQRLVPYVWSRSRKALVFSVRLALADAGDGQPNGVPTSAPSIPEAPLPTAPVPREGGGDPSSFAFDMGSLDDPAHAARWDRCHEIRWAADLSRAPAYGLDPAQTLAAVTGALADVSAVTGLRFRYVGRVDGELTATTAFPGVPGPGAFGGRFDLAITAGAEQDPGGYAFDELGGGVVGVARTLYEDFRPDGYRPMVLATVVLDAEDLSPAYTGPFPPVGTFAEQLDSTVRHEIGHAVGLAHVDDETQLMNGTAVEGVYDYANGDRQGMWALASQPCIPA